MHCATSRKVAGLIPHEVDFFNVPNISSRTMALESTQPLTEMSTRNLSGGIIFYYYYYLVCEAIGTAATPGLLCQPQVIVKTIV
jgi:hypothetical protein